VATHSTAAKVKPASTTTAASATHATTASALHEWSMLVEDLRSKVGLAFAGSCVAANRATPLARAVLSLRTAFSLPPALEQSQAHAL
jgi:hypothetical protein